MKGYKSPELKALKMQVELTPPNSAEKAGSVSLTPSIVKSKNSRTTTTKGIGLNLAISPSIPLQGLDHDVLNLEYYCESVLGRNLHPKLNNGPRQYDDGDKYDFTQIETWDIDEQLRLLALKEMGLVELKDNISKLTLRLKKQEDDLHNLRHIIQKSLYKELTVSNNKRERKNSNPREEAIANTRNRRRTLSSSLPPNLSNSDTPKINESDETNSKNSSKLWNGFQKPFNLLQQFDSMMQAEFEKSLIPQNRISGRLSEDSISTTSTDSPLKLKSKSSPTKHKSHLSPTKVKSQNSSKKSLLSPSTVNFEKLFESSSEKDDVFQAVSTSLWSFVNDVKANVLSSLSEEQENSELARDYGSKKNFNKQPDNQKKDLMNNSDYEDEFNNFCEEEDVDDDNDVDEQIDLSIYKNLRKP